MAYPKLTEEPGAVALAAQIKAGTLSPLEACDAAIARIEGQDGPINAVVVRDFDRAREAAKALDGAKQGDNQPLFGVPMTIKESFAIEGLPSCWGLEPFAGNTSASDSKVVRQLKAAGAVMLGKTNIPPQLADWQSNNPVYGRTNNPHDLARSPGGSSGGSAAAVASGMVPCEYGTDIGGSVRVPAHFCGVWGHKTSWGLISKQGHDHPQLAGIDAHDGVLSIAGPIARNADDIELLLRLTANVLIPEAAAKPLKDCRILLVLDHPVSKVDSTVRGPIEDMARALSDAGVAVDTTSDLLPDLEAMQHDYLKMLNIAMARGMPGPDGKRANATDWFDLLDAQARAEIAFEKLFETYDYVLAPPAPILAFEHEEEQVFETPILIDGEETPGADALAWAAIATFPNLPATVLPIGATGDLPCGVQVIGPKWHDLACIEAARGIDRIVNA